MSNPSKTQTIEDKVSILRRELLMFALESDPEDRQMLAVPDKAITFILLRCGNPEIKKLKDVPYENPELINNQ